MNLSDDRITVLAQQITDLLLRERLVEAKSPNALRAVLAKAMVKYVQADTHVDEKVRAKIASLKRFVPEGSQEWEILYQQYYEQELAKTY